MTTTDTNLTQLIINELTQAEYDTITPNANELYITTDGVMQSTDVINALGYTPVNKAGDTMTGGLTLDNSTCTIKNPNINYTTTTAPSTWTSNGTLRFYDTNDKYLAFVQSYFDTNNYMGLQIGARRSVGGVEKTAYIRAMVDVSGNAYATAPTPASNSDGTNIATTEWVNSDISNKIGWTLSYSQLVNTATTMNAATTLTYSLATYLPSDNYIYEVMYSAKGTTGSTSGNEAEIAVGSGLIDVLTHRVASAQTRTSSTVTWAAAGTMLIGNTTGGAAMRAIYIRQIANSSCTLNYFRVYAYRKLNYAL